MYPMKNKTDDEIRRLSCRAHICDWVYERSNRATLDLMNAEGCIDAMAAHFYMGSCLKIVSASHQNFGIPFLLTCYTLKEKQP